MAARDDHYRDDPYGDGRDGSDDDARSAPRRATRPARPAWDAMTYGVPSDARRPVDDRRRPADDRRTVDDRPTAGDRRTADPAPYEPAPSGPGSYEPPSSYPSAYEPPSSYPSAYEPATSYPSNYEPSPTYPSSYDPKPAAPSPYPSSYPAATDSYPAASTTSYPAASDSYAPDAYTSYQAPSPPGAPPVVDDQPPAYVASGLYLDEPQSRYPDADDHTVTMLPPDRAEPATAAQPAGRERRSLPAFGVRVAVGVVLGAVVLASLLVWRPAFLVLVAVAVGIGVWELARAVQGTGANPPVVPLVAGGVVMTGLAWWGGIVGLTFGLAITVVAAMAWRFAYGVAGYGRDVTAATLIVVYVPFLAGFAALLGSPADGDKRVLATLIAVVLSDTGGYLVGALFGRHPMAPSVSPKKSWEGFGGSLAGAAIGSAIVISVMFDASIVAGLLFGLGIAVASVIGDLGESLLKRDLGVKDMSGLLPGHGGLMDRLDSILFAAPAAYLMFAVIAPV